MNTYVVASNKLPLLSFDTAPPLWLFVTEAGDAVMRTGSQAQLRPPIVKLVVAEAASGPEGFRAAAEQSCRELVEWSGNIIQAMVDHYPEGNRLFILYEHTPEVKVEGDDVVVYCNVGACLTESEDPPLPLGKHIRIDGLWVPKLEIRELPVPGHSIARWCRDMTELLRETMLPPEPPPPEVGTL